MSLDITIGTRAPEALDDEEAAAASPADAEAVLRRQLWLQNVAIGAASAFGAVLSSGLAVLLYLR